ncbi:uncharacterized protein EMH_0050960 [Eimeria mitis]|uniref:Uncharacterized protein n=1 Tax=Eimeria mitis TaxID=44415 RepID=U6JVT9_9EIME|nr:uncharacterized protein EMH_0050960 [Eimeria mitis]CDJ29590.1 hypothetical protein, conserved [Eimeria mitis]
MIRFRCLYIPLLESRDVLVSADVDTLVCTARELLLRAALGSSPKPTPHSIPAPAPHSPPAPAPHSPPAPAPHSIPETIPKSEGFWSVFGRRAKESLHLFSVADAAIVAAALHAHHRDTGFFVSVAPSFGLLSSSPRRSGAERRFGLLSSSPRRSGAERRLHFGLLSSSPRRSGAERRLQQQQQLQQLQQQLQQLQQQQQDAAKAAAGAAAVAAAAGAGVTVAHAAVAAATAAAAANKPLSQGKGSEVLRILEAATLTQPQQQQLQQLQQLQQQQQQQQQQLQLLGRLVWRKIAASVPSLQPAELNRAVAGLNCCGLRLPLLLKKIKDRAVEIHAQFTVPDALELLRGFAVAAFDCEELLQSFEPLLVQHTEALTRKEVQLLQQLLAEANESKFSGLRAALTASQV